MNHSEGYRIWKIEVLCRENPLQMNKRQSNIHYSIFKTKQDETKRAEKNRMPYFVVQNNPR